MTDEIHYLTADSLAVLRAEYDKLNNKTIPEIAKRIDEAKQQGDLSENAEYHQAREDMSWARAKISELDQILQNVKIIVKSEDSKVVSVGNTVVVKVNGKEREYTIVGPQEVDITRGYISNESPLGSALLGSRIKDRVDVVTPAGKQIYEIVRIK
jgi:transcription elongation factor GreA